MTQDEDNNPIDLGAQRFKRQERKKKINARKKTLGIPTTLQLSAQTRPYVEEIIRIKRFLGLPCEDSLDWNIHAAIIDELFLLNELKEGREIALVSKEGYYDVHMTSKDSTPAQTQPEDNIVQLKGNTEHQAKTVPSEADPGRPTPIVLPAQAIHEVEEIISLRQSLNMGCAGSIAEAVRTAIGDELYLLKMLQNDKDNNFIATGNEGQDNWRRMPFAQIISPVQAPKR